MIIEFYGDVNGVDRIDVIGRIKMSAKRCIFFKTPIVQ